MSDLSISDVTKTFGSTTVLSDISLTVQTGDFCALLGPSGSGKTTLLNLIAGLDTPEGGSIRLGGEELTARPAHQRGIGMVFQNYALFPHMSVQDNVEYGLRVKKVRPETRRKRAQELLDLVGLAHKADAKPAELSGGQQQRVALARALAVEPKVLLLDEPLSALDRKIRLEMQKEIKRIHRETQVTTVMVTHDQEEALDLADQVVVLNGGRIQQDMKPQDIYGAPANVFVGEFLGLNSLRGAWYDNESGTGVRIGAHSFVLPPGVVVGDVSDEDLVDILIRPESIGLANEGPLFSVVSRRFLGPTMTLSIDLGGGQELNVTQLTSLAHDHTAHEVGLVLHPEGVSIFPVTP